MELVASIIGTVLAEPCRLILSSIRGRIRSFLKKQSNIAALQKDISFLMYLRDDLRQELNEQERQGKLPRTQVEEWLRRADDLDAQVKELLSNLSPGENKSLHGSCFACWLHYRSSGELVEKLVEVKQLTESGSFFGNMVFLSEIPNPVEHIPGPPIGDRKAASENLTRLMDLLCDDKVKRIGVYGMGGVGKSTLVKNLNNEIIKSSSTNLFSIIIWATVSREPNLRRIQAQIAERLNLMVKEGESEERLAIRLHKRLEKEKYFLLILDDVWEAIDLDLLGIPRPEVHPTSKIILTSRSLDVCREMMTDVNVEVAILNDEESWELFCQQAGEVVVTEEIRPLAEAVAKECSGLLKAIVVVGASMRGTTTVALWKDALSALQHSMPSIRGFEDKVYKTLKWSYDSLQDKQTKSCFLFCCMYPENSSMEVQELIRYWFCEGLLDEGLNYEELENRGIAIIQSLRDSSLLQLGTSPNNVKMHDVVRDVGIWIAGSLEDGCRSLVRSGIGLCRISENELCGSHKRVSFMNNEIETLPDHITQCQRVSTLLLQGNRNLQIVPNSFLQEFKELRILDLSGSWIQSLPLSLLQLVELRALILRRCLFLEELPSLEGLRRLQVLDLSGTRINCLPEGLEKLTNLRQLDISETFNLRTIPSGVISRLRSLEFLNQVDSAYKWGAIQEQTPFEELRYLEQLMALYVHLENIPYLKHMNANWSRRIRKFKVFVGRAAHSTDQLAYYDDNCLILSRLHFSEEWIGWLLVNATSFKICLCEGLDYMLEKLVINSNIISNFAGLKSLEISYSHSILKPAAEGNVARVDMLPNLEKLRLHSLSKMESISDFSDFLGLRFTKLRIIDIFSCPQLKYLLSLEDVTATFGKLEEIRMESCDMLKDLFRYPSSVQHSTLEYSLPNLQIVSLKGLPNLKALCRRNESWPRLHQLELLICNQIRMLPLSAQNADTIRGIRGQLQWWNRLEWDNEDTRLCMQQYFIPIDSYGHVIDRARSSA